MRSQSAAVLAAVALVALAAWTAGAAGLARVVAPELRFDDEQIEAIRKRFEQWIQLETVAPKVAVRFHETAGWSLYAKADIAQGERLAGIPRSKIMSWKSAERTPLGEIMKAMPKHFDASLALIVHLISENALVGTEWGAYLDTLPTSYSLPLFWSSEELAELQGSPIVSNTALDLSEMKELFENSIKPLVMQRPDLFPAEAFTRRALLWAKTVLWTRPFHLPFDIKAPHQTSRALVPLLDMMNLNASGNVGLEYNARIEQHQALALRPIAKGEQLVLPSSGSNTDILYSHGFVFAETPAATLRLPLSLPEAVGSRERRIEILKGFRFAPSDTAVLYIGSELNGDVLAFYRIAFGELAPMTAKAFDPYRPAASPGVEARVWGTVRAQLAAVLASYETTAAEDEALLAAGFGEDEVRLHMAVVVRLGEKRVLAANIAHAEAGIARLAAPPAEL